MWLKVVIVVLFIGLVISLFSGLFFLIQDQGKTMRTWQSLSVRLVIAVLLMSFIVYGFYTGQLGSKAPWDQRHGQDAPRIQQTP
ncbi:MULTISPECIES: DUF2909 domain-containing protein [Zhongshania]|jgi:type III secretory pathway component EscS|uniref:Type III secretory pathway component EscS n=1 Tax=Zhongshania antarctica TaxID=641702 RepID=A0A840R516_9GAMM|nr:MULTISPECIES: DUF2909 domain-containing protein [Zhongshania]MBB5187907.1 type III secretory pathway component EscS [Zhongshania antarctica]